MARERAADVLRPTVFDRLLEAEGQGPGFPTIGLRELKRSVGRDLEWLLNAKVLPWEALAHLPEARRSIFTFGIPDFSTASWRSESDARRICGEIEAAVKTFEPRLLPRTVRVVILPAGDSDDFRIRFRIEGLLHVEPISEPVFFDSSVELDTGAIAVEGMA